MTKVAIIGGGPAGVSCAIQLKRYLLEPVVYEMDEIGGLLRNANIIENYPGFPFGIAAEKLTDLLRHHISNYEIEVLKQEVSWLDVQDKFFVVRTSQSEHLYQVVVIATGTKPIRLQEYDKKKELDGFLFYDIHPLRYIQDKLVGIIGGGDAAFDYAINLSAKNHVLIFNRSKESKCLPLLFERAEESDRIEYHNQKALLDIERKGDRLVAAFKSISQFENHLLDYLIFAIGREPKLDFLSEGIKLEMGSFIKDKRIWLAGDVKNATYRQVSIATGDGLRTAMEIYRTLNA